MKAKMKNEPDAVVLMDTVIEGPEPAHFIGPEGQGVLVTPQRFDPGPGMVNTFVVRAEDRWDKRTPIWLFEFFCN